jgi:hypothetical protein
MDDSVTAPLTQSPVADALDAVSLVDQAGDTAGLAGTTPLDAPNSEPTPSPEVADITATPSAQMSDSVAIEDQAAPVEDTQTDDQADIAAAPDAPEDDAAPAIMSQPLIAAEPELTQPAAPVADQADSVDDPVADTTAAPTDTDAVTPEPVATEPVATEPEPLAPSTTEPLVDPASPATDAPIADELATDVPPPTTPEPVTPEPVIPEPTPAPTPVEPSTPPAPEPEPQLLPRVEEMPTGTPGVSVRRGTASTTEPSATPLARAVEGVTVGRLPRIGQAPPPATQASETQPEIGSDAPAYLRFSAIPEAPTDARWLGVVLTDSADSEAAILDFPTNITIAMDPYDPDGPRRAAAYRMAGHDIVLLAGGVPPLATAQDIATILEVWMRDFPEVVALMDVQLDGIGRRRALAREIAGMMAVDGYGVIALRSGLDSFVQSAHEAGLASASVYRMLDDGRQGLATMRRLLDRAAFEAQRSDSILVAGSAANPDTIAALTNFVDGFGRSGVSLVPASAMLAQQ